MQHPSRKPTLAGTDPATSGRRPYVFKSEGVQRVDNSAGQVEECDRGSKVPTPSNTDGPRSRTKRRRAATCRGQRSKLASTHWQKEESNRAKMLILVNRGPDSCLYGLPYCWRLEKVLSATARKDRGEQWVRQQQTKELQFVEGTKYPGRLALCEQYDCVQNPRRKAERRQGAALTEKGR